MIYEMNSLNIVQACQLKVKLRSFVVFTPFCGKLDWKYVMIYLLANVLGCVATTAILNIMDRKNHSVLNKTLGKSKIFVG